MNDTRSEKTGMVVGTYSSEKPGTESMQNETPLYQDPSVKNVTEDIIFNKDKVSGLEKVLQEIETANLFLQIGFAFTFLVLLYAFGVKYIEPTLLKITTPIITRIIMVLYILAAGTCSLTYIRNTLKDYISSRRRT